MKRPYIVCHILTALDGRIAGPYMESEAIDGADEEYERVNAAYGPRAWLCGRVTSDENFTHFAEPELWESDPVVQQGDFVASSSAEMYYISIDPSGRLGWQSNTLHYKDRPAAHIVEVLTAKASDAYRAFLQRKGISYIVAGDDRLDCRLAAEKLFALFGIELLMLSGGGAINWSFQSAGLIDELSLIIAPLADGTRGSPTVFDESALALSNMVAEFSLTSMKKGKGDSILLRYLAKNAS